MPSSTSSRGTVPASSRRFEQFVERADLSHGFDPRHHALVAVGAAELGQPQAVGLDQPHTGFLRTRDELVHARVAPAGVELRLSRTDLGAVFMRTPTAWKPKITLGEDIPGLSLPPGPGHFAWSGDRQTTERAGALVVQFLHRQRARMHLRTVAQALQVLAGRMRPQLPFRSARSRRRAQAASRATPAIVPGWGRMCSPMPMRQGLALTRARKHFWLRHMRA